MVILQESKTPTPWAVFCERVLEAGNAIETCNDFKPIYLTEESYKSQLNQPSAHWRCPRCGHKAEWDVETWENQQRKLSKEKNK